VSFQIRPVEPDDHDAVMDLLRAALSWDEGDRYERFFDWKHRRNAFGASPAWVAVDGDRILGYRTWMRWGFVAPDGEHHSAVRAVDTATHPDARGQGIFRALTEHAVDAARDEGVSFVFNTPNDQSRPGYLKMGWQQVGRPRIAARFAGVTGALRTVRARVPADKWSIPCTTGEDAAAYLQTADLEGALAASMAPEGWRTAMTPEVLRWRYGQAPAELYYRALTISDDPVDGFVLFRVRQRGTAKECVIGTLLAPDQRARSALRRALARSVDADYVLEMTSDRTLAGGFVALPDQGPILTWRALTATEMPPIDSWALSMGDVELF
jgi:GNAT superfamily N-acetyltransferase